MIPYSQECSGCGHIRFVKAASDKFCSKCGTEFPEPPLPYGGESLSRAVFQITFEPVVGEFDSKDAAHAAARDSCWGEDRDFGHFKVEQLNSAVPIDEYPYICGSCRDYVSRHKECRCGECGAVEWQERE